MRISPTTSLGLQALRHIDHIAHHRIFHALLGTNIAHDGFAAVDANTQVQCGLTTAAAHRVESGGSTLDIQGSLDGALRMVQLLQGRPKQGEQTIPEEFVEGAPVLEQHVYHEIKVLVEDVDDFFRLMPLSEGCKVAYIREEHRHLTARTTQGAQTSVREDLRHDLRTEIATQGLAQDLRFGDIVNQHHYALIVATLIVEHLPMDRVVMCVTTRSEQAMGTAGDMSQPLDLISTVLERDVMEASKHLFYRFAYDVGRLEAAQALHGLVDLEDAMRVLICDQETASYALENTLVEILQRLKFRVCPTKSILKGI
jgi:hypothetical protein